MIQISSQSVPKKKIIVPSSPSDINLTKSIQFMNLCEFLFFKDRDN